MEGTAPRNFACNAERSALLPVWPQVSIAWQAEQEVVANLENAYLSDLPVAHKESVVGAGLGSVQLH